ncbi:MAG: biosynthetic-type acetolactate synthase large subunit [Leptospiraceae bacterium]|nr:biosynthetic-type acetolactate synthase large subunit [Leptospiraceae bacterium]
MADGAKGKAETKTGEKNGSQVMLDVLSKNGVDLCFGYPGGAILPFYDELYHSKIKHILVRHEQGAVHAAEGYAKATGKLGMCIATSGPGATNLITGITDAKMDSVPLLALTGQVATSVIGSDAFQECDTYGMSIPITKYNALLRNADDVARVTQEAITVAQALRPGPALIDFPKDVQTAKTKVLKAQMRIASRHYEKPKMRGDFDRLIAALARAERPLLYVGGGAITGNAYKLVRELAEKADIPVYMTLMGLGAFPAEHKLSLGMAGMHGTAYANRAIQECDFMLALGARFDDRVALNVDDYGRRAVKAMVDIDEAEINKRVPVDIHIVGDLIEVLAELNKRVKKTSRRAWVERITKLKEENPLRFNVEPGSIKPQQAIHELWKKTRGKAVISTDVGQHQMWAAQYYTFNEPRNWLSSGGLGTMGFGFPAAIGAALGRPDRDVFVITGDGSFQMCMQELATIAMYQIPVKILLFNNGFLGMVRQWQELFYQNRFSQSTMNYNPDFVKICSGYDIPAKRIDKQSELSAGIDFLVNSKTSALLEVTIPEAEKVYPMIASGARYEQMVDFNTKSEKGNEMKVHLNRPDKSGR